MVFIARNYSWQYRIILSADTASEVRQLQNKHYDGADAAVKGQHYQYAHDFANHWVDQQYLPDAIRDRQYYQFGDNKNEQAAAAYWQRIKGDKFKKWTIIARNKNHNNLYQNRNIKIFFWWKYFMGIEQKRKNSVKN